MIMGIMLIIGIGILLLSFVISVVTSLVYDDEVGITIMIIGAIPALIVIFLGVVLEVIKHI